VFYRPLISFMLALFLCGCSLHPYDPDNPEEYYKYWKQEENRQSNIIYSLSSDPEVQSPERRKYGEEWEDYY